MPSHLTIPSELNEHSGLRTGVDTPSLMFPPIDRDRSISQPDLLLLDGRRLSSPGSGMLPPHSQLHSQSNTPSGAPSSSPAGEASSSAGLYGGMSAPGFVRLPPPNMLQLPQLSQSSLSADSKPTSSTGATGAGSSLASLGSNAHKSGGVHAPVAFAAAPPPLDSTALYRPIPRKVGHIINSVLPPFAPLAGNSGSTIHTSALPQLNQLMSAPSYGLQLVTSLSVCGRVVERMF